MINQDKWLNSLPKNKNITNDKIEQLDPNRWVNTISKNNTYNPIQKYSLMVILFVSSLFLISIVKNETRNLQKEINNLEASIKKINYNLGQAILDNEVITSPENISQLAKEYLDINLVAYKKSQILNLSDKNKNFAKVNNTIKKISNKEKIKNLQQSVKNEVAMRIKKKKTEIKKLQELYEKPEEIPKKIKTQVAKQIKEKKIELENIYNKPKSIFTFERVGKWTIIQVVKLFLGIPVIPGR